MFAVIKTGGKQYKVAAGDIIKIEKLNAEAGASVEFDSVLMVGGADGVTVGAPLVEGAVVTGEVLEQAKGKKVVGLKKRRRKHSSARRWGHRQLLTVVKIDGLPGAPKAEKLAGSEDADDIDASMIDDAVIND